MLTQKKAIELLKKELPKLASEYGVRRMTSFSLFERFVKPLRIIPCFIFTELMLHYLEEISDLRKKVEQIKEIISIALEKITKTDISEIEQIKSPDDFINLDALNIQDIISTLADKKAKIITGKKEDIAFTVYSKIFSVRQFYDEIKSMKKALEILTHQQQYGTYLYPDPAIRQAGMASKPLSMR